MRVEDYNDNVDQVSDFNYPKVHLIYNNQPIQWVRGGANYTGRVNGKTGNTSFGNLESLQKLKPTIVKPNSLIYFQAEQVEHLNNPKVEMFLTNDNLSEYENYPITDTEMIVPGKEGLYVFSLSVDWGKGDNSIDYWFKLQVRE